MKLVGRGSEASVYFNESERRIEKRFDRSRKGEASIKASREFQNLEEAKARLARHDKISVPTPLGISEDGESIFMEFVPGSSLLWHLTHNRLSDGELREYAQLVHEGLSLFNSSGRILQPDFTLDHVIVRSPGVITFLDFGNGSNLLHGIEHETVQSLFSELIGSTVYECSRFSRTVSGQFLRQVSVFLRLLADLSGVELDEKLKSHAWRRTEYRMNRGSFARVVYYVIMGKYVFWRIWRQAVQMLKPMPQTSPVWESVTFVVSDFPADFAVLSNGIHKAVHGLAKGMASSARPVNIKLLAIGPRSTQETEHGYSIEFLPSHLALISYVRSIGKRNITILNSIFSVPNSFLAYAFKFFNQPFAVAPHLELSDRLFAKNKWAKWIYWNGIEKRALRWANGIHMLDSDQCKRLVDLGIDSPSFASPNGILDSILDASPDVSWTRDTPVRFHFFGRIETKTKGLDMLLTAVSAISVDHSIEVFLQGPDCGDLKHLERDVAQLGLESVVHFVPPDYATNPIDIMSQYDVFILPSRFEGFPVAAVEAMVSARPMVMTNVGGLAPIVKEHNLGIVVEPTAASIESGMREIIAKRDSWEQIGKKARQYAVTHFRWSAIGETVLNELDRLAVDG